MHIFSDPYISSRIQNDVNEASLIIHLPTRLWRLVLNAVFPLYRRAHRSPTGPVSVNIKFRPHIRIISNPQMTKFRARYPIHIITGSKWCGNEASLIIHLPSCLWRLGVVAPRSPMGPLSVNIKFGLVHIFADLLIARFVHRVSGWCAIHNTQYTYLLLRAMGVAAGSTASSRRWLCSIWSECNLKLLRRGRGSTSRYGVEENYFLSIPQISKLCYIPCQRNNKNGIHLPVETCRPSRQIETYSVLILLLYPSYKMNSNSRYFSLPENKLCYPSSILRTCWNNVVQMLLVRQNSSLY